MELSHLKKVHCVGIGGIGISAIAKYLKENGVEVTGSDAEKTEITDELQAYGIPVSIPYAPPDVPRGADLLIYSEAVPTDSPDREAARTRDVPERSGGEFLGILTGNLKTIAVSGTNGKSSTTAMIGAILESAGVDPTVIVGSKVPFFPLGNVRVGKSEWLVLEADEYLAKFLQYVPYVAIVTNIAEDHFDFYDGIAEVTRAFQQFVSHVPESGIVILNADDEVSMQDLHPAVPPVTFGFQRPASFVVENIRIAKGEQRFTVRHTEGHEKVLGDITLRVPGRFNIQNAMAATAACLSIGVGFDVISETLSRFPGIWRRFEVLGHIPEKSVHANDSNRPLVISDYGHHPAAIFGTLEAAREFYPDQRIVLVYQPHQHARTKALFMDFAESIKSADLAIISDIYDVLGRNMEKDLVSSQDLVAEMHKQGKSEEEVVFGGDLKSTKKKILELARPGDVIIVMGAGDIDLVARELI